jgi:glycine/D-amino acid oxidase-like deaminating enzyme
MAFGPASAELLAALVRGDAHPDADLFDPSR